MDARRNTIQRRMILDSVKELDIHATAEQVYERIAAEHPAIGKATVYRNLSRMAEAGELQGIGNFGGSAHYDHNLEKHYHFICDKCGRVFDVMSFFPEIEERIEAMDGFTIKGHSLTFSGLCPECGKLN
ncbi:MAG: transcriptional repressor [Clostridiales bacterium]|jgi:Fe2+ or Zn2+ uptake regulation protein|nr:transcriptional repressor [Clostridiales bacterium]